MTLGALIEQAIKVILLSVAPLRLPLITLLRRRYAIHIRGITTRLADHPRLHQCLVERSIAPRLVDFVPVACFASLINRQQALLFIPELLLVLLIQSRPAENVLVAELRNKVIGEDILEMGQ